jgi:quinol monooxygenase YgiN
MTTNVIVTFTVKPDRRSEFLSILNSVKNDLPMVEGCNGVQVYSDKENADIFTLVENWDSEEKHQKHISGVVESGNWDVLASHLVEDPKSSYFNKL